MTVQWQWCPHTNWVEHQLYSCLVKTRTSIRDIGKGSVWFKWMGSVVKAKTFSLEVNVLYQLVTGKKTAASVCNTCKEIMLCLWWQFLFCLVLTVSLQVLVSLDFWSIHDFFLSSQPLHNSTRCAGVCDIMLFTGALSWVSERDAQLHKYKFSMWQTVCNFWKHRLNERGVQICLTACTD